MAVARADTTAAAARREAELDELTEQIRAGVEQISSGEQWQRFLEFAASFHTYSARNQLLMFMQKPDLSQVAGYNHWKRLGRQVRKGEKGLRIFAPVTVSTPYDRQGRQIEKEDLDSYAKSEVQWRREMVGVKPTSVFDVSQTDGDPLPSPPGGELLRGAAPEGMWDGLVEIAEDNWFLVQKRDLRGEGVDAEGYTSFSDRMLVVREGTDDAEAVATLTHEVGHMLMHDPGKETDIQSYVLHRGQREVEAESFTYIVAAKHGLDTSGYSFDYINGWAAGDPDKVLASAERITKTARTVLDRTLRDASQAERETRRATRAADVKAAAVERRERVPAMAVPHSRSVVSAPVSPERSATPIETRMHARAAAVLSSAPDGEYPQRLQTALVEQRDDAQRLARQLRDAGVSERAAMFDRYEQALDKAAGNEEEPPAPAWRSTQAGLRAAFDAKRGQSIEASREAKLVRAAGGETALGLLRDDSSLSGMTTMHDRYDRTVTRWRAQSQTAHLQGEAPVYDRGALMRGVVEATMTEPEREAQRRELAIGAMTAVSGGPDSQEAEATIRGWESAGTPSPRVIMTTTAQNRSSSLDTDRSMSLPTSRRTDTPSLGHDI